MKVVDVEGLSVGAGTSSKTTERIRSTEQIDVGGLSVGAGTSSDRDEAPSMLLNVIPHHLHSL